MLSTQARPRGGRWPALRSWSSTPKGLASIFVAGIAIRLVLARGHGFPFDVPTFSLWSWQAARAGLGGLYADAGVNYPPVYMGVLLVVGKIYALFSAGYPPAFVIKLPAVASDVALAAVCVAVSARLAPGRAVRGAAATAVMLNPAVIFLSSVWGQVDSLPAALVLLAFLRLTAPPRDVVRELEGLGLLVLAMMTKPQAALVAPVFLLVVARRHFQAGLLKAGLRLALLGAVTVAYALAVAFPAGIGPVKVVRFFTRAASHQPVTSAWAFNLWGIVGFNDPDRGLALVGLAAFGAGVGVLGYHVWRTLGRGASELRVLVFAAAASSCLAFALLTRMHERYLFPALGFLAAVAAFAGAARWLGGLSLLYLVNVYFPWGEVAKVRSTWFRALYGTVQDSAQKKGLSAVTLGACLWVAWRCTRALSRDEVRAPAES